MDANGDPPPYTPFPTQKNTHTSTLEEEYRTYAKGPFSDTPGRKLCVILREEHFSEKANAARERFFFPKRVKITVQHDGNVYYTVFINEEVVQVARHLREAYGIANRKLIGNWNEVTGVGELFGEWVGFVQLIISIKRHIKI